MGKELEKTLNATSMIEQYDICAKRLFGHKIILANILRRAIDDFKDMEPEEIVSYIEGEHSIGVSPVEPGLTNIEKGGERLKGLNSENSEINEGTIYFDIICYVKMKNGLTQVIINLEIQKNKPKSYNLLNRAVFYVSRLISSQKERDFVIENKKSGEEVNEMCNLGEGIFERGIDIGRSEGVAAIIRKLHENGLNAKKISDLTGKSVGEVDEILQGAEVNEVEACYV